MLILVSAVVLAQLLVSGAIFATFIADISQAQIGRRALDIAQTLAQTPGVEQALKEGDRSGRIQSMAERIRARIGAEFIVVADRNSVRLSHPNPENIGKTFVGGDEFQALQGEAYISESRGTLGTPCAPLPLCATPTVRCSGLSRWAISKRILLRLWPATSVNPRPWF
jgi:sensor histidine kinase regulating citrate/malate metabolism